MNFNEYCAAVLDDAVDYVKENLVYFDTDHDFDYFEDHTDIRDSITGNDNGSYYCNSYLAEQAVKDCVFDDDFHEAMRDYCGWMCDDHYMLSAFLESPENADVIVRIVAYEKMRQDIEDEFEVIKEEECDYDN